MNTPRNGPGQPRVASPPLVFPPLLLESMRAAKATDDPATWNLMLFQVALALAGAWWQGHSAAVGAIVRMAAERKGREQGGSAPL